MRKLFEVVLENVQEGGAAELGIHIDAELYSVMGGEENTQEFFKDEKNSMLLMQFTQNMIEFAKNKIKE